jgi:serine protease AprX
MSTGVDGRNPARVLVAFAAVAALLGALLVPAAGAGTPTWIVPAGSSIPGGARVLSELPVAGALVVTSSTAPTGGVRADTPLSWRSSDFELDNAAMSVGAPDVWQHAAHGEQLGADAVVALIDTGVAPIPALESSIAGEINFSGPGRARGGDGYGHGTFLASLISSDDERVPGVAPAAGILSLKVADHNGDTDLLKVLSALQWLHGPGRDAGVRIATLALGVEADTAAAEILDEAVSNVAQAGTLVLTAAGVEADALTSPATAPGAFAVGAVDADGTAPAWSGIGADRGGAAKPDVSALGQSVVGHMPRTSVIGQQHSAAYIPGTDYMPGTGTSMSTAIAAGVAALASSARPDLDGQALATALRAAGPILRAVDAYDAALASKPAPSLRAPAHPGSKAKANETAKDEADPHAGLAPPISSDSVSWRSVSWRSVSWRSVSWRSVSWRSVSWRGSSWGDADWGYGPYGGARWTEDGWQGDVFNSVSWRSVSWRSVSWRSVSWRSVSWRSVSWRSVGWGPSTDLEQ